MIVYHFFKQFYNMYNVTLILVVSLIFRSNSRLLYNTVRILEIFINYDIESHGHYTIISWIHLINLTFFFIDINT